jgi:hypothetical protein
MNATTTAPYGLVLTEAEHTTLLDVLEAVVKETEVELRRTEAFAARQVVRHKEETLQAILRKVRAARPTEAEALAWPRG